MGPFHVMAAGCGGFVHDAVRPPTACRDEPTVTGLRLADPRSGPRAVSVWQGFACDRHAAELIAPRRLLPRDRDRLATRRDRAATERGGGRWAGEREGALARGRAAHELIGRAMAWAAAHPPLTPPTRVPRSGRDPAAGPG